jgi:hypothetical protein
VAAAAVPVLTPAVRSVRARVTAPSTLAGPNPDQLGSVLAPMLVQAPAA